MYWQAIHTNFKKDKIPHAVICFTFPKVLRILTGRPKVDAT